MDRSDDLKVELATFEARRADLEREHMGEYVVIRGSGIHGFFPDCDSAARRAFATFDRDRSFLLRQIGRRHAFLSPAALFGRTGAGPVEDSA